MIWFTLAVLLLTIPSLIARGRRMGLIGMWVPKACPPAQVDRLRMVICCEHNPCPDRPPAAATFTTQPWRCPQCGQWWVSEKDEAHWSFDPVYVWQRVSCEGL